LNYAAKRKANWADLDIGGIEHYKQGQNVKVLVNANDPTESKLDNGL